MQIVWLDDFVLYGKHKKNQETGYKLNYFNTLSCLGACTNKWRKINIQNIRGSGSDPVWNNKQRNERWDGQFISSCNLLWIKAYPVSKWNGKPRNVDSITKWD